MGLHTPIETPRTQQPFGVEILDLRHFSSQQLRPLLERETQLWAELMSWDYRSSAEMILRYVDSKILPGYAAVEGSRVGGYAFFVYEGSKGVIGDLFADNSIRLPGDTVERRLSIHVIETLQRSPGVHRIEAQLLTHESGVLSGPFLAEGFRQFPRLFMVLPLALSQRPHIIQQPEFEYRRWMEGDFQPAASVITTAYRNHVDSEINDQYRSLNGSLRFLNNIVRFPGCGIFDGNASFVAIHKPTRSIAGLLLCSRVREDVGHVTQVCVLPEYRGRHIGESLMGLCTQELRTRNFSALSLTVTEANRKAVELYRKLSFTTRRKFDAFVWEG
ncbi:MAG TPA: GNAT family N-acetyltransferase [Candidatus Angelobacter sp.]|jgi:ribosomal protein S18 acetylase RimI-like enzyme|nr:GNAT family N-acetyltransferase [Candidatus Angelobacter sp.]